MNYSFLSQLLHPFPLNHFNVRIYCFSQLYLNISTSIKILIFFKKISEKDLVLLCLIRFIIGICPLVIEIYRAKLIARFSRITVTFTCPGYCISSSIFLEIIKDRSSTYPSLTLSLSTITRNSLPACIA